MDKTDFRDEISSGRVVIRRSARRKKTVSALIEGRTVVIAVPQRFNVHGNEKLLISLVDRIRAKSAQSRPSEPELLRRAEELTERYFRDGILPRSVRWVTNQNTRWGSTSLETADIRLSHRLLDTPSWVQDAVLIHELAHLRVAGHGSDFQALVERYPKNQRAADYLAGYSRGLDAAGSAAPAVPDEAPPLLA